MPRDKPNLTLPGESAATDSIESLLRDAVELLEPPSAGLPRLGLLPGEVLADRFVIERLVCSGGMGTIHRAVDLTTRAPVAIKVLASAGSGDALRFEQEVLVLAELSHPSIVRYIAHGTTPQSPQFLAMEWLEGEDLAQRLARSRSPLTVGESVLVLRRACAGVAAAHALGVVHRDLKPSNLFLVDGDPERLKVLDFGIARQLEGTHATLTQSGMVLGTVGYMSPEQAMGCLDLDARTDVFALGCVMFECLTGRAAFSGANPVAILAKVLREEPPTVSELRPDLDEKLDALLARMLAKDAADRPKDAATVLLALDDLDREERHSRPVTSSVGLTATERMIVAVILGTHRDDEGPSELALDAETGFRDLSEIRQMTRQFGTEPVVLRGGAIMVVLTGHGAATDQAAQATRCALLIRQRRPELRLAVAMGRAEMTDKLPIGGAIDRAAALLMATYEPAVGVAIDALTAALLEPSFVVRSEMDQRVAVAERADHEAIRPLMGKPTPFVGRDKELALLELTLHECIEDSVARVALVTGPPGQGKSRLRQEFVRRARDRFDPIVLVARADPLGAGSSFLLVRALVRQAIGLREGDDANDQMAMLRAHVSGVCAPEATLHVVEFLGALIGIPATDAASPQLRAARNDPQIMSVWLCRAFGTWLAAFCSNGPVVIILEDLHWGDSASVAYLDATLRELKARSLMVLALARPEVHESFPNLWAGAEMQEIALGRLTSRAAERLVREVFGEQLDVGAVARIIDRADGNAFYLEEILRHVAEGDEHNLPETVIALVQSRLERLEPEGRRIVRAASIFGETFWRGGVAAVLGRSMSARELESSLRTLQEHEVLARVERSRFPAELEYEFRHGLLREAAYAMLTDVDRATGHVWAGDWLERVGEKDAVRLADHFERGGASQRAIPWLVKAAQTAADGGNTAGAVALARRGIACGAESIERGHLLLAQAQAVGIASDWSEVGALSQETMALLPAGSIEWFRCVSLLLLSGAFLSKPTFAAAILQEILKVDVQCELSGPYGFAICGGVNALALMGQSEAAASLLARAEALRSSDASSDPVFVAWLYNARAILEVSRGKIGLTLALAEEARGLADRTGAGLARAMAELYRLSAIGQTGHLERTSTAARELVQFCKPLGMRALTEWTDFFLSWSRVAAGEAAEALAPLEALLRSEDRFLVISARATFALALLACGDAERALREATASHQNAEFPWSQASALRTLALLELRAGRPEHALELAERGIVAATQGTYPLNTSLLRLTRAEALHSLNRSDEARIAIRTARDWLLQIAVEIQDVELRESFLVRVQVHARTIALAREWLGDDAS